jgi:hypothetical protein
MIPELDIWRVGASPKPRLQAAAANLLIRQRDADAVSEATRLAGRMLDRGERDGWQLWTPIRRAIEALQGTAAGRAELRSAAITPSPRRRAVLRVG